MKQCWHIQGFEGTNQILDLKVKCSELSEKKLKALLMALTASSGHTYDEIVGSYVHRRSGIANDLIRVQKDGLHPVYLCGTDPHFRASITTDA